MPIPKDQYWAGPAVPYYSRDFAAAAIERFDRFQESLRGSRLYDRMKRSWMMENARSQDGLCDETQLGSAGDNDEVVLLRPGRYRRLNHDAVTLVMESPPDYEPQTVNNDPESQAQAKLVVNLLDWYRRVMHLEDHGIDQAYLAQVLAGGFMHVRWDAQIGEEHGVETVAKRDGSPVMEGEAPNQKPKQRIAYKGEFAISVRSFYEVAYDVTSPDRRKPRWWVVLEPENRFDLLALHEHEGEKVRKAILNAPKWSHFAKGWGFEKEEAQHDDTIGVYWVYAEPSPACPEGRKAKVLDSDTVLLDGPLDEDRAGVFRLTVADVIFKNGEAHTNAFDGMATAKAHHATLSTIMSNQASHGMRRLIAARKANIEQHELDTGLAVVHFDHFTAGSEVPVPEPKAMDYPETPQDLFTSLDVLEAELDLVMHSSPVNRGDPEAVKGDSGSKTALMFSAVQKIGSGFVRAKQRVDEDVATFLISSLRRHATTERIVTITGKDNQEAAQEFRFTGKNLDRVPRVLVRKADPSRDTFSGRMAVGEMLLGYKDPEERKQMQSFLFTGKLEAMMTPLERERMLLERENAAILDPSKPLPPVHKAEQHLKHMAHHDMCAMTPEAKSNPVIMRRLEEHNAMHEAALTPPQPGMPPNPHFAGFTTLLRTGQKPLPPAAQLAATAPGAQPPAEQDGKPEGGSGNGKAAKAAKQQAAGPKMPEQPQNPATGERVDLPQPEPPQLGGAGP